MLQVQKIMKMHWDYDCKLRNCNTITRNKIFTTCYKYGKKFKLPVHSNFTVPSDAFHTNADSSWLPVATYCPDLSKLQVKTASEIQNSVKCHFRVHKFSTDWIVNLLYTDKSNNVHVNLVSK